MYATNGVSRVSASTVPASWRAQRSRSAIQATANPIADPTTTSKANLPIPSTNSKCPLLTAAIAIV
jgi:hypothetical protein